MHTGLLFGPQYRRQATTATRRSALLDWLVVILVVIALAMIGIVSLLHRGRVRLWSIAMILLGLGVSIFLYTQIHIFQNWQSILYIVCSIVLLLVLV